VTREPVQPNPNCTIWSWTSTESLGAALLRLETARELALARLKKADSATIEHWVEHEQKVEQLLDDCERRLAVLGEDAVPSAVSRIRALELEVCEFITQASLH
jgi:hypothetical protein